LREQNFFQNHLLPNLAVLLDVVALGTVADLVPLDHNNRVLVRQGLSRIRHGLACPGIQALMDVARRDTLHVQAQDFGFSLGPRLNAAGRLEDMSIGIHCLLSEALSEATALAQQLDALNVERKYIEADMQLQAENLLRRLPLQEQGLPRGLALFDPTWHMGVVGILASRVKESHHRPVICFAQGDKGMLKGSARSVSGVHIRDVLDRVSTQHPGVIVKFGGHAMAAGLTILETQYDTFAKAFADAVAEHLSEEDCQGVHWSDGELTAHELTMDMACALDAAGPFGSQFPQPLFDNVFQVMSRRPLGEEGKHVRYTLKLQGAQGYNAVEAVHFGASAEAWVDPGDQVHVVYSLDLNHFRGESRLQLKVAEIYRKG
jgi:single-stranded-DNA-specific exonuclease